MADFELGFNLEEQEEERLREAQHIDKRFENLYTNKDRVNELFASAEGQFALQYSNEPEEVKARSVNWEFLSKLNGRDLYMGEYAVERDKFALEQFGAKDVNDQQLFDLIAKDYTRKKDVQTATQDLYNKAIKTGFEDTLAGKPLNWVDQWESWRTTNKDLIKGEDEWPILSNAFQTMQAAQDALGARGSVAANTWAALNKYVDGQATEADLHEVARNLAKTPPDQLKQIYGMIQAAAAADKEDPKDFMSFIANVQKSATRGFGFAERPELIGEGKDAHYEYIPLPQMELQAQTALNRAERMPDGPAKDEAIAAANEKMQMATVVRDLKALATEAIDPVTPIAPDTNRFFSKSTAEKTAYTISGSLGFLTAAAANPWLGLGAIWHDEYDKFRRKYPEVPIGAAQGLTTVIAYPQALLERFGALAIANKIPGVSTWIKGLEGKLMRQFVAGTAGVVTQTGQELLQNVVSEFGPGLIAAMREDMPDADWDKVWNDYKDSMPETIAAAVIFGGLSIGTLDLTEMQSPEQIMNDRFLAYMGYNVGQRNEILTAPTPQQAQAILRAEYGKRSKSAIENGKKIHAADIAAAERMQNDPTMPTMNVTTLPDGTREYNVTRPAPQETASVTVVDPKTGVEQSIEMEAGAAKKTAQRQMEAMQKLSDCLGE